MAERELIVTTPDGPPDPGLRGGTREALRIIRGGSMAAYALPLLFVLEVLVFSALRPDTFATTSNLKTTLAAVAVNLVVAMAILVPLVCGRFDLSVGSTLGLSAVVIGQMMADHGLPLGVALLIGFALGVGIGIVNGFFVAVLRVDALIVTLGTATVLVGITTWIGGGDIISSGLSSNITDLGLEEWLGVPAVFWIAIVVAVIVWYVLSQIVFGRHMDAVGSNEPAAVLVGVNTRRVVYISFLISGFLAAFAGALTIANQGVADPTIGGINVLLPALAGSFLSVAAFTPGKYNVPGTVVGLLFVATMVSGLAYLGAEPWVEGVINGSAVIVAVSLSTMLGRRGQA